MIRKIFFLACALIVAGRSVSAQEQAYKGWPGHDDITDLKGAFAEPPKGYGNVPFYWWTGDPLDIARLNEQLEMLSDASTDGLCVSYNHTHSEVDTVLNALGHGPCGRVSGGEPRVMSEDWWKIWNGFSTNCAARGIGLGMDDYVIAWPKNGEFIDTVLALPSVSAYQGALEEVRVPAGVRPGNALTELCADADSVTFICTTAAPWLHPDLGRLIVEYYFQPFVDHMDEEAVKGMNYFFQDELQYGLNLRSWCEDMPEQFRSRKGYDIVPHLQALFIEDASQVDEQAAKVRLDYAEVLTQLAEERYFKPIYEWNASRGLIYGCDPEGRGLRPLQYLDYFRAISWFTAPGNDAPARGSSFRQTKVSSSIAHLYGRPRTWLEAFHSMGWDANGALLKAQLDHHIIAGGNLLCMHGLYYSTHGGWWEWAPPCFHFRMPYWPHMKLWLKYAERMCFLLSQGTHVCDVAIMYPTETMQAVPGSDAAGTFAVSEDLSVHGIDYDFIDYQSLQKSQIKDGSMCVAGESYKVLVLADTRAMHKETLEKIREFAAGGGVVIASGYVMPQIADCGAHAVAEPEKVAPLIRELICGDFRTSHDAGRVLHRRIGDRDVYMVMDVEKGENMFFRAHGMAERWDAMDGSVSPLPVMKTDEQGTWINYDGESGCSMLVVFSKGEPVRSTSIIAKEIFEEQKVTGDWRVEVIPTMNNRWGDFRLPASDEFIGVEAREMKYAVAADSCTSVYGYGPYMMTCDLDGARDLDAFLASDMRSAEWTPYIWSWQYGVPDSPGSQGWHGLKARVDSRFLILDKGGHQLFRTNVYAPALGGYRLVSEGVMPYRIMIDGAVVQVGDIHLKKGWHDLLVAYADTRETEYSLEGMRGSSLDRRDRGMVMIYPSGACEPQEYGMYDDIVASKWFGTPYLIYNTETNRDVKEWSFKTAPGTVSMDMSVKGRVKAVRIDGRKVPFACTDGVYHVDVAGFNPGVSEVSVSGIPDPGAAGAAFFDGPVKLQCAQGLMPEGDWSAFGAVKYYSGAMKYSKSVDIKKWDYPYSAGVVLDLGDVDATCEVRVNGELAGILIGKPYSVDITPYLRSGANDLEVLVYSSLANHYSAIPSPYRGTPRAGLIGPVEVKFLYFKHLYE